jgi:hypothetical protein
VAYYRDQFPSARGWLDGKPDADVRGGHLLCLVNHSDDGFDQYVEIYPYSGKLEVSGPASVHRVSEPPLRA